MKSKVKKAICIAAILLLLSPIVCAQENLSIYGYFSTRIEKVLSEPSVENGAIVKQDVPAEWDYSYFNVMMQYPIDDKSRIFINMNGAGGGNLELQNFWGEYAFHEKAIVRLGKIYRKFGLYNELLDAVPTYYGIEAPELFDGDHLIVSRITTMMFYGSTNAGAGRLNYSLSTDNGEGGAEDGLIPLGWDLNYKWGFGDYTLGASGYLSGGETQSDVGVGAGSPNSGVLPWMARDDFSVFGAYGEGIFGDLTVQAAFWTASHDAQRDPASVVQVINNANPNAAQRARFLIDPNGAIDQANIDQNGNYDVSTYYVRAGYSIASKVGELAPYVQWDYYKNEETIKDKGWGGDNEAGLADDGVFTKGTVGIILRPNMNIAVKLDGSAHFQKLNGENNSYPEVRFDVSYLFGH